jgi:hypothetical protein
LEMKIVLPEILVGPPSIGPHSQSEMEALLSK